MFSSAIALLVYSPVYILSIIGAFLLGIGLAWIGYDHWSGREKGGTIALDEEGIIAKPIIQR